MIYALMIPGIFLTFVGICAFLWLCLRIYKESRLVGNANALVWRHPNHSKYQIKLEELKGYIARNRSYLEPVKEKHGHAHYLKSQRQVVKVILEKHSELDKLASLTHQNLAVLEFANLPDPAGRDWEYNCAPPVSWFMRGKKLKWLYEKEGNPSYKLAEYDPDEHIDSKDKTTSELFDAIEWDFARDFFGSNKDKRLKTLAMGGVVLLGLACLVGIVYLSVFLQGG